MSLRPFLVGHFSFLLRGFLGINIQRLLGWQLQADVNISPGQNVAVAPQVSKGVESWPRKNPTPCPDWLGPQEPN